MISWQLFKRYLFSSRTGSVVKVVSRICITGVAVGICAFIVVLSVMNGFNSSTKRRYLEVEPHVVVPLASETDLQSKKSDLYLKELVDKIDAYEVQDVFLRSDESFSGAVAKGISKAELKIIFEKRKLTSYVMGDDKQALTQKQINYQIIDSLESGDVLVGIDLARRMGLYEGDPFHALPPETIIMPAGEAPSMEKLRVKSLFVTDVADIDDRVLYYIKGQSLNLFKNTASRTFGFDIRLHQPEQYAAYVDLIKTKYAKVESWADRNASLFLALKVEKLTMTTFLSLSALVTSFTIITVLILLITQKRQDIAMLRIMGLPNSKVQGVFTGIGMYLFGIGLFAGIVFGVLLSVALETFPIEVLPEIYYDRTIPSSLQWDLVFWITVLSVVLGVISAWVPARQILKISHIELLRK